MTASCLVGKSILLTGASGTVAGGLLQKLLGMKPRVIRALDSHEDGLFRLQQRMPHENCVRWLLGDIRDVDRLCRAMEGVDVVFHTAALKHVGIGEYNPFEIVQTNLVGLQNVIQAALQTNVERVIFTSSDKAVNPTNAMGASKLMGERLIAAAQGMRGTARTRFVSVRFGNVLGSNGSVVRIFEQQIAVGGPVTLTDERMTRFVMSLSDAVRLVLRAAELAVGGELFVLKMPALRIVELAAVMIERLAGRSGYTPDQIAIKRIGPGPGEKLYEELLTEGEAPRAYEDDELIVFLGEEAEGDALLHRPYLRGMRPATADYRSDTLPHLTPSQIGALLDRIGQAKQSAYAGTLG